LSQRSFLAKLKTAVKLKQTQKSEKKFTALFKILLKIFNLKKIVNKNIYIITIQLISIGPMKVDLK